MTNAIQNPNLTAVEQLTQVLRERMALEYGEGTNVKGLVRLSGGASRETWSFDALKPNGDSQSLILKRDPMDRQADKKACRQTDATACNASPGPAYVRVQT